MCPVASQQRWPRSCKPVPSAHDQLIAPDQRVWERSQNIIRSQRVRDQVVADLIHVQPAEIRSFLQSRLTANRAQELREDMLAAGIPL